MKLTKLANLLVIALVLSIAATGCRKKPVGVTPLPNPYAKNTVSSPGPSLPSTPGGIGTAPETGVGSHPMVNPAETGGTPLGPGHQGWAEDVQTLQPDTVYFDFDSSVVKASEKPKVTAVADYLKANPEKALRVEGNCDERGTEEYNRALGDRRALAVREELIAAGITADRVDTKTWGKDNPANDAGHDEAAWKKNRRDDFIVLTAPAKP
ncbi:MAG TPA: OmpA family protein [Candidatus Acidoferrum sp.]|nr:OmpA family protein [Candidatus Acidoferrum sp.]